MCGIAGFISYSHPFSDLSTPIAHRGPDAHGQYSDRFVRLEHRRLAIIDLSEAANQPMVSPDENYVIVFNGEIYNHLEIRERLKRKGVSFRTQSDTEVILNGYIELGIGILNLLNGIFSFAVYDKSRQQLVIARDHFGIKPLYYYYKDGAFLFSSEIKSFLSFGKFDRSIDINAIFNYLQFLYCPGEQTAFAFVKKLLPGHFLRITLDSSDFKVENPVRYYTIPFNGQYESGTRTQWQDRVEHALRTAVKRQLLSDVPIGFFLSGGIDSSLVVALAKQELGRTELSCFTADTGSGMQAEGFKDDITYALEVGSFLGVNLTRVPATSAIVDHLDKMIWSLDEPLADPAAIHVYNIARGARDVGIKVLLGGTAADDLFSGYRRHTSQYIDHFLYKMPTLVRRAMATTANYIPQSGPAFRRYTRWASSLDDSRANRMVKYFAWHQTARLKNLFNPELQTVLNLDENSTNLYLKLLKSIPNEHNALNQMLFLEMSTFLPDHNLNYTDKMGMAASVEIRVPYLDVDLVSLACKIPPHLKMRQWRPKAILREIARRYLPEPVVNRPKTGFGAPVRSWIKNDLIERIQDQLSPGVIKRRGIFSGEAVNRMIKQNTAGKEDNAYLIFSLLALESWLVQFYDQ